MEKARGNPSIATGESQEQEGGYSRSTKRQKESPLCYIDGHLSSQKMRSYNPNFRSTKAESCSMVTSWKKTLEPMQFLLNRARLRPKDVIARLPDCDGQAAASGSSWTKFVRTPTCWPLVAKTLRGSSMGTWMAKSTESGMSICSYVDDISMAPMWKKLMKNVDFDEPTSFLDHM